MKMKFTNHNATVAKIRAMYGKRVTPQDYSELASRQSVAEIADYLKKNTHYSELLSSVDVNTVHRGFLESLLKRYNFETYLKITGFERINRQEFYNYRIINAEVDVILSSIRHINAKSDDQITDIPIYINGMTCFDLIEIAKVRTFDELLTFLRRTPYYDVLKQEKADENGKVDYSQCEYKLRSFYFNRLEKTIAKFSKTEADKLNSMILTDIDLVNVINAYRMKSYFDEDEKQISSMMLPFSGRLSEDKQREIYSAADEAEFLKRFAKTYYGRQISDFAPDANNLEANANRLRFKYAKLALKSSSTASVSVYAFMYLMGVELRNLISIIEGVRYGVPAKEIEDLIIV
jgi:V/A-type H+-transporting ATPase subunit C